MPSNKNLEAVKNLTEKLDKANAIYFTDYLGLDVVSITKLRKEFVSNDVEFTIANNTLIKLAAKDVGIEGLDDFLNGPTAMALSYDDPTNPAKVIKNFLKVCFLFADNLDLFKIYFQFLELLTINLFDSFFVIFAVCIEQVSG